jgi:hypothetical protein
MENDKNMWHYSFKYTMPFQIGETNKGDWIDKLDSTQLEMLYLDVFGAELTDEECVEAQQMLENIGIKC